MNLLIGTPAYNGLVNIQYVTSLITLLERLRGRVQVGWRPIQPTLVTVARNAYASLVLQHGFSHLLFIDADMEFQPSAVERLIALDKPVAACAYPSRSLDLAAFHRASRQVDDPRQALSSALGYHAKLAADGVGGGSPIVGGVGQVEAAPTGLMLIKREVFEAMIGAYPDLYCDVPPGNAYAHMGLSKVLQCFEPIADDSGLALGEDFSFCKRWRDLGGEIWMIVDETVGHIGPFTYAGRPIDKLRPA